MKSIAEIEQEIIEEFEVYDDWMDKYEYIIELGKDLPLIKGCQSRVWVNAEKKDDVMLFTADSDAIITKGVIALLIRVLSNQKPSDIATTDLNFIKAIGLQEHLSPTRANGLVSMIKQLKLYAIANA